MTSGWGIDPWGVGADGGSESVPPVVTFEPPSGTTIVPSRTIIVTITDANLKRAVLTAEYPSGAWEVIHMQDRFAQAYRHSTKEVVPNGFKFTLRRIGNWPAVPTIHADPFDTSGNEAL